MIRYRISEQFTDDKYRIELEDNLTFKCSHCTNINYNFIPTINLFNIKYMLDGESDI